VGFLYREVNSRLRTIGSLTKLDAPTAVGAFRGALGPLSGFGSLLWKGLKRVPVKRAEDRLYRGIRVPKTVLAQWSAVASKVVAIPNFSSFSGSAEVAQRYLKGSPKAGEVNVLLTVETTESRRTDQFATKAVRDEFESLLAPFAVVEVVVVQQGRARAGGGSTEAKIVLRHRTTSAGPGGARPKLPVATFGRADPPAGVAVPPAFAASPAAEFWPTILKWFGSPNDLRLLYACNGRAEWDKRKWHAACDAQGATLTIVFVEWEGVKCVIGGFTPVPWTGPASRVDVSASSGGTYVFALKNTRGDAPYRLKAKSGAKVLRHWGDFGPIFRDEKWQCLVGIHFDGSCVAGVQSGAEWSCCPEARAGVDKVGLVADGRVEAKDWTRVETWKWQTS
jgi:hypothetical protein